VPQNIALVVAHSGASRALAASAYNRRVAECAEAARILGVRSLRDATPGLLQAHAAQLNAVLYRRARHVISETERTMSAAAALEAGAVKRVGALMQASHESLRRDYEVSSPALDALVDAALQVEGVYGSRLTGAGFGGCTITVLGAEAVSEFAARVPEAYRNATGQECRIMECRPSASASLISVQLSAV
jgi:galactokinase